MLEMKRKLKNNIIEIKKIIYFLKKLKIINRLKIKKNKDWNKNKYIRIGNLILLYRIELE